jgi:hypothetical protein
MLKNSIQLLVLAVAGIALGGPATANASDDEFIKYRPGVVSYDPGQQVLVAVSASSLDELLLTRKQQLGWNPDHRALSEFDGRGVPYHGRQDIHDVKLLFCTLQLLSVRMQI